jgi:anthranilate phosphoribosyltransferase
MTTEGSASSPRETETDWPLTRLMSDVVGSGPKSAADMTPQQARAAFEQLLEGSPDPTTLGAFLLANRWKRNTPEELAAFIDVMRERSVETAQPSADPVDCGANYDGKEDTAILGVGAGLVAAAAGTPVAVHSGDHVPSQGAWAYKHVLDELGVVTDLAPATSARMIDEVGFGFYYQPRFNPGIHQLLDRREQMGVRTVLNTVETLANPANASVHLASFYHLPFAKKLADAIERSETLGFDRVTLFQGLEGYDDLRPGSTKVAEWEGGSLTPTEVETGDYGMAFTAEDLEVTDIPADSARITEEVLAGERNDQFADAIALNAAVRLSAGGDVDELADGIEFARSVIASGDAGESLAAVRAFEPAGSAR